jgi:hypothetical protein
MSILPIANSVRRSGGRLPGVQGSTSRGVLAGESGLYHLRVRRPASRSPGGPAGPSHANGSRAGAGGVDATIAASEGTGHRGGRYGACHLGGDRTAELAPPRDTTNYACPCIQHGRAGQLALRRWCRSRPPVTREWHRKPVGCWLPLSVLGHSRSKTSLGGRPAISP